MDRERTPRWRWIGSVALLLGSLPLVFGNVGHVATAGQNEEWGAGLVLVALGLAVVGLVVRGSLRAPDARATLIVSILVVLGAATMFAVMLYNVPDHAQRSVDWAQVEDTPAFDVGFSDLPPGLADALRGAVPGARGSTLLAEDEYAALWARLDVKAGGPGPEVVVRFEGRAFRLAHGATL